MMEKLIELKNAIQAWIAENPGKNGVIAGFVAGLVVGAILL